jgi:hypothetical protein
MSDKKPYKGLAAKIIHFWRGMPEARIDPTKEVNRYPVLHEQIRRACCDVSCARMSEVEAKAREMGLHEMEAWAKAEREKWAEAGK